MSWRDADISCTCAASMLPSTEGNAAWKIRLAGTLGSERHSPRRFTRAGTGNGETTYARDRPLIVLPEHAAPTHERLDWTTLPSNCSGAPVGTSRFESNGTE